MVGVVSYPQVPLKDRDNFRLDLIFVLRIVQVFRDRLGKPQSIDAAFHRVSIGGSLFGIHVANAVHRRRADRISSRVLCVAVIVDSSEGSEFFDRLSQRQFDQNNPQREQAPVVIRDTLGSGDLPRLSVEGTVNEGMLQYRLPDHHTLARADHLSFDCAMKDEYIFFGPVVAQPLRRVQLHHGKRDLDSQCQRLGGFETTVQENNVERQRSYRFEREGDRRTRLQAVPSNILLPEKRTHGHRRRRHTGFPRTGVLNRGAQVLDRLRIGVVTGRRRWFARSRSGHRGVNRVSDSFPDESTRDISSNRGRVVDNAYFTPFRPVVEALVQGVLDVGVCLWLGFPPKTPRNPLVTFQPVTPDF